MSEKKGAPSSFFIASTCLSALIADKKVEAMKKLEGTPFFSDMLGKTQFYFYNNKAVWPKFGYGGSSWEKGGYINRGFNDVKWTEG